jgi:carbonic anhydrase
MAEVKGKPGDLDDLIENAVVANVQYQVKKLKQNSDLLTQLLLDSKLKIVGARYDLDTGEVTIVT